MNCWTKPVDFFARHSHYIDHLAPIWKQMDQEMRGEFYIPASLANHAKEKGVQGTVLRSNSANFPLLVTPEGEGPLVVCAHGDLQLAHRKQPRRPMIYLEHGIGLSFNHSNYAGGIGVKQCVSLFLDPNESVRRKNRKSFPHTRGEVIGTPKMDSYLRPPSASPLSPKFGEHEFRGRKPVVCISFHWDGKAVAPEAGNALGHYRPILGDLARCEDFTLIGHGHPRMMGALERLYNGLGIEIVREFDEVMERADLYVNDCSSTLYEFCVTGKPVIILNAPQFRRNVHTGIRFWEYTDVGAQVNAPGELLPAIREQLAAEEDAYAEARERAVADLYPYLGEASKRAAEIIQEFVMERVEPAREIKTVDGESVGIVYMCFGEKAAAAIARSMHSLRGTGLRIPVCVVGDRPVSGTQFIEWKGESPFDASQSKNFQFRSGRVKPFLYDLSPYDRTLYIDADTEFIGDILPGFKTLSTHEMALAMENLSIGKLYNKPRAGWEINIKERDATIAELGGDGEQKFLNSGVIFFRKCEAVKELFAQWSKEWLLWQQWDEQLALVRALHKREVNYRTLSIDWNHPHRAQAKVIFHNYGRGTVRVNVPTPDPPPFGCAAFPQMAGLDTRKEQGRATRPPERHLGEEQGMEMAV